MNPYMITLYLVLEWIHTMLIVVSIVLGLFILTFFAMLWQAAIEADDRAGKEIETRRNK